MVTVKQVEEVTGIKNKAGQITALIPLIYEELEGYVGWTDLTVIKMIEYHLNHKVGLSSEGLSRHSVSFMSELPASITRGMGRKL